MKKNFKLLTLLAIGSALSIGAVATMVPSLSSKMLSPKNGGTGYTLNLTATSGQIVTGGSGTVDVLTSEDNVIKFSYTDASPLASKWGQLTNGGTLYNHYIVDELNHNRLSGVTSLTVNFSGGLKLDYTWDETLSGGNTYRRNGVNLTSGVPFDFAAEEPSFVKLRATADTEIDSIVICYTCTISEDKGDVFQISTANDLVRFTQLVNSGISDLDAKLTADIDMTDVNYSGVDLLYTGTFDGDNHKISNMTILSSGSGYDGLFAIAGYGAKIQNLDVSATISGTDKRSAILVGSARNDLTITNVITRGSVTASAPTSDDGIGGVIGFAEGSTTGLTMTNVTNFANVSVATSGTYGRRAGGMIGGTTADSSLKVTLLDCANYGTISARSYAGGMVGYFKPTNDSTITNCSNFGTIASNGNNKAAVMGGIVGYMSNGTLTNNYSSAGWELGTGGKDDNGNGTGTRVYICASDTSIDALSIVGKVGGASYTGVETVGHASFPNGVGYTVGYAAGGLVDDSNIAGWGATTSAPTLNGTGTLADPWQIIRPQDYFALRGNVNGTVQGGYYKLMKDIDFDFHIDEYVDPAENVSRSLAFGAAAGTISKSFTGTFDGNNHKVRNMKLVATAYSGFFGNVTGATIKDFTMLNPQIYSSAAGGASATIVGEATGVELDNVHAEGGYVRNNFESGGLVGRNIGGTLTLLNCSNSADLTTRYHGGGLVGVTGFKGNKQDGTSPSTVSITNSVNTGTIFNYQTTKVPSSGIAGILGRCGSQDNVTISTCINAGNVNSTVGLGTAGIFGINENNATVNISNCKNYGTVSTGSLDNCLYVGGIVGFGRISSTNTLTGCINYGDVVGVGGGNVGGIIGVNRWQVSNCQVARTAMITSGDPVTTLSAEERWNGANHLNAIAGLDDTAAGGLVDYTLCGLDEAQVYTPGKAIVRLGQFNSHMVVGSMRAYGRLAKLANGKNIFTLGGAYALSKNNDIYAYHEVVSFASLESEYVPGYENMADYQLVVANMQPLVLSDGRLVIFYRTNPKENYSSIRARISTDNGETFTSPIIIFENFGERGAYEPFGVEVSNTIQLFISCDITSTRLGNKGPDNSAYICTDNMQNVLKTSIDISSGNFNVGSTSIVISGTSSFRRPGMTTIVRLDDGSYLMALEHNGSLVTLQDYAMVIGVSYSLDLVNWTPIKNVITPTQKGDRIIGGVSDRYRCQAPYVQKLGDGRVVISYMSNEYYEGDYFKANDDLFRTVEVALSNEVATYGADLTMNRIPSKEYANNSGSNFGGLAILNSKLILITNDYTFTSNDTKINNGMMFTVSNIYERKI